MADDLADGEFWLPSQFLTDTDDADFDSSTPSSVTETESDEDEFLAELTRQISRNSLLKDSMVSLSPQSTLCPGGVTPTGRVSPVQRTDHLPGGDAVSFSLLNTAAGEVAKMRLQSEQSKKGTGYFDSSNWLLRPPPNHDGYFYRQQELSQQQLQASKFQQLWSQEMVAKQLNKVTVAPPQQVISRSNSFHHNNNKNNNNNRTLNLSPAAWPPLQHQSSRPPPPSPVVPGMRPVFLGAGPKRESAGTGVFLPRRVIPTDPAPPPSRKSNTKPGGSAVIVPEKVVQALNSINAQTRSSNGKLRGPSNGGHGPKRNTEPVRPHHAEIHLPSEWTY